MSNLELSMDVEGLNIFKEYHFILAKFIKIYKSFEMCKIYTHLMGC